MVVGKGYSMLFYSKEDFCFIVYAPIVLEGVLLCSI